MDKYDLTQGIIWKKLLGFFFPILGGMLFQQLYNTVDAIIVGKCVGTEALAAVGGSASVIVNLVIGFFNGLASGATVVISLCYGARENERLSLTVHTAMAFCLTAGALLTALCYFLSPWAVAVLETPADTVAASVSYLRIYFAGTVPMLIFNVGSGILRAMGDSKRPLYYLIVCCVLNIALDLLFVQAFSMGVKGVALATVISESLSAVLVLVFMTRTDGPHRLSVRKIGFDGPALKKTLRIGVPAGVQAAMYSLSNLVIQAAINGFGTVVVAAWAAAGKFDGIYWVTSSAFGMAICAFVGQCYGAGLYDRVKKSVGVSLAIALGTSALMGAGLLLLAPAGLRILSDDGAVIQYAVRLLFYFAPFYVVWAVVEIMSNALRGTGDSVVPMVIVILGVCVLRVLWIVVVRRVCYTMAAICLSYPVTWAVTAAAMLIYYRHKLHGQLAGESGEKAQKRLT